MILIKTDGLHGISCHKSHTNNSDGCELNKNGIIQYTLYDSMTTIFRTIKYDKYPTTYVNR